MPPEIYALSGAELETKLRKRREDLYDDVMRYYDFIAEEVTVTGTDDAEHFQVTGTDENLLLTVTQRKANGKQLYQRTFSPDNTRTIQLLGLGADDAFTVADGADARIRLLIDGGKGNNSIQINSGIRYKLFHSDMDAKAYEKVVKELLKIEEDE